MLRLLFIAAISGVVLFAAARIYTDGRRPSVEVSQAAQIEWPDLIPDTKPLADLLSAVPMNVRFDLGFISKVLSDAESGVISRNGPEYRNAMGTLEKHRASGIDVDTMLEAVSTRDQAITRRGEAVNTSLNGELVRLPGYALPLEANEDGVTEFLLVPYVGACIHVPPPPPNQVVYAKLDAAYQVKELYDPVMLTGRLQTQSESMELDFVDGQAEVPLGYSMQVVHVEPLE